MQVATHILKPLKKLKDTDSDDSGPHHTCPLFNSPHPTQVGNLYSSPRLGPSIYITDNKAECKWPVFVGVCMPLHGILGISRAFVQLIARDEMLTCLGNR